MNIIRKNISLEELDKQIEAIDYHAEQVVSASENLLNEMTELKILARLLKRQEELSNNKNERK